jgi:uncharacterized membrane protein (DUF485 family)
MHNVAHSPATSNTPEETGRTPVMFARGGEAPSPPPPPPPPGPDFERIQRTGEFAALRSRRRWFVFPVSLLFFAWYMTDVLLAAYAHDFMNIKVFGQVNIAMVFGLLQFVTTIVITAAYIRFANRRLDPQVEQIRLQAKAENP